MLYNVFILIVGLVLIIVGGDYLTDGAEAIARKFKISPLVIGLTVVAFGSSTPDFVVCLMSTLSHKTELALGDIVGANILDVLLVSGVIAIITPIPVSRGMYRKDIPLLAVASLTLFFLGDDVVFDQGGLNIIDRSDGLVMLMIFAIFMVITLNMGRSSENAPAPSPSAPQTPTQWDMITGRVEARVIQIRKVLHLPQLKSRKTGQMKMWQAIVAIVGGLGALIVGGNWIVKGASAIALATGMSEALVGLTIVGIGSSIPDLATSLIATLKRQPGIALGNIVGACVLNVLFILGFCSCIFPLKTGNITFVDFSTLAGGSLLLWLFCANGKKKVITRAEGIVLFLCYLGYLTYLILK